MRTHYSGSIKVMRLPVCAKYAKIPLAVFGKRDLRIDINLGFQILPPIAAEDLSFGSKRSLCLSP